MRHFELQAVAAWTIGTSMSLAPLFIATADGQGWLTATSPRNDGPKDRGSLRTILARIIPFSQRVISFSGYQWRLKRSAEPVGPGPNIFHDESSGVWVDARGRLHLKITAERGVWKCVEVICTQSLGYGKYTLTLETPPASLPPNVVLGYFTWSDHPDYRNREIDVEFSKWGQADNATDSQFVVQALESRRGAARFRTPGDGASSHSFTWEPGRVHFESASNQWDVRDDGAPVPGDEQIRINLWIANGGGDLPDKEVEVVVSNFAFVPLRAGDGPKDYRSPGAGD